MPQIDEILAMLELPEHDLFAKVLDLLAPDIMVGANQYHYKGAPFCSLADLAFRLRDEVVALSNGYYIWLDGIGEVTNYMEGEVYCETCKRPHKTKALVNWFEHAQPIHWIAAALIAKQLAEK